MSTSINIRSKSEIEWCGFRPHTSLLYHLRDFLEECDIDFWTSDEDITYSERAEITPPKNMPEIWFTSKTRENITGVDRAPMDKLILQLAHNALNTGGVAYIDIF